MEGLNMKRLFIIAALAAATLPASAANVGVSINVGQPGYYGRIDLDGFPQPQVIYTEPVVIQPVPAGVVREPIYLRVPPGHAKDWRKHCRKYNACGQPVYFVQDRWYNDVYVQQYRDKHGEKEAKKMTKELEKQQKKQDKKLNKKDG
jgi:hypothetical protein